MKIIYSTLIWLVVSLVLLSSCEDGTYEDKESPNAPYVLSLGIEAGGVTTYYVVSAENLMTGTIDAVNQGIEQNGYHDYTQGNQTIFDVGGLGITSVRGITRDDRGYLQQKGNFVFDKSLKVFTQIDANTMLGAEIADNPQSGDQITFYSVDINSVAITQKKNTSILPLASFEWPSITGLCMRDNKVFMTYFHMNPNTWETKYTDKMYVAVFSYPEMTLDKIITDERTGPAGSWYTHDGIFETENGDIYTMSNCWFGYSQKTKNAAFLRIPNGQTEFDDYYFDFETISGGLQPAHIKYIGNGLLFAEVSTPDSPAGQWSDAGLKCCIIDLNNKTVTDVEGIPVHNGSGGRRFAVMADGGYVYIPITSNNETSIYRVDPQTATAQKGATIDASFVVGFFKLD